MGKFSNKICHQKLLKIAKSGLTDRRSHRRGRLRSAPAALMTKSLTTGKKKRPAAKDGGTESLKRERDKNDDERGKKLKSFLENLFTIGLCRE